MNCCHCSPEDAALLCAIYIIFKTSEWHINLTKQIKSPINTWEKVLLLFTSSTTGFLCKIKDCFSLTDLHGVPCVQWSHYKCKCWRQADHFSWQLYSCRCAGKHHLHTVVLKKKYIVWLKNIFSNILQVILRLFNKKYISNLSVSTHLTQTKRSFLF